MMNSLEAERPEDLSKGELTQRTGICKYCGQITVVMAKSDDSEEKLNELATDRCTCEAAIKEHRAQIEVRVTRPEVEKLFGNEEIVKLVNESLYPVARGIVKKVTIDLGDIKAIVRKKRGQLAVDRRETITDSTLDDDE